MDKGGKSFAAWSVKCPDEESEVNRAFVAVSQPDLVIEKRRRDAVHPTTHTRDSGQVLAGEVREDLDTKLIWRIPKGGHVRDENATGQNVTKAGSVGCSVILLVGTFLVMILVLRSMT